MDKKGKKNISTINYKVERNTNFFLSLSHFLKYQTYIQCNIYVLQLPAEEYILNKRKAVIIKEVNKSVVIYLLPKYDSDIIQIFTQNIYLENLISTRRLFRQNILDCQRLRFVFAFNISLDRKIQREKYSNSYIKDI